MRREAAELNLDSEAVLEAAFEHGYNAIVITDADFGGGGPFIRFCNPAFWEMTGYTEEELIGQSPRILQGPDTDRKVIDQLNRKIRAGEFFEGSAVNYRKDGVPYVVQWNISPVRDAHRAIVAYISIQQDITARFVAEREAEEARRQQARADERYRRSMDNAAVGMCLTTPQGRFTDVNDAMCQFFGYDAETLTRMTWQELTAPDYLEADVINVGRIVSGQIDSYRLTKQFIHAEGHRIWGDLSVGCLRNPVGDVENFIAQITDITAQVEADECNRVLAQQLQQQSDLIAASEKSYRLIVENTADVVAHIRDGRIVWVSPSVQDALGAPPEYWLGREVWEIVPPEDRAAFAARVSAVMAGEAVKARVRLVSVDDVMHWVHLHAKPFYDADGSQDGGQCSFRLIDDEVAAEQAAQEARRQQARADTRYHRSMDNAAIGMCLIAPDGRFEEVNDALCELFGYDAQTLMQKTWQELTAQDYLEADLQNVDDVLEGRTDSYRMVKQYIHANGRLIWGDLSVSCIRDEDGQVENFVSQITDITAQVEADERNRVLAQQLQYQTDRMRAELESAARYMASIMPRGLQGLVTVSSRYLPSQELGGDSFDYTWVDDDHLLVYLIDVSGHGLEPALLSVSVHNMLRSGSIALDTLLMPEAVFAELNHLFRMEKHNDHYFTVWYGVYQASTRTLRYASAGAPPALAFTPGTGQAVAVTELSTKSAPLGMFEDAVFTSRTYEVPPGCRILVYSDGASEITPADAQQLSVADFTKLSTRIARSPGWSLDELIDELRALTPTSTFEDDCSLIQLTFH